MGKICAAACVHLDIEQKLLCVRRTAYRKIKTSVACLFRAYKFCCAFALDDQQFEYKQKLSEEDVLDISFGYLAVYELLICITKGLDREREIGATESKEWEMRSRQMRDAWINEWTKQRRTNWPKKKKQISVNVSAESSVANVQKCI